MRRRARTAEALPGQVRALFTPGERALGSAADTRGCRVVVASTCALYTVGADGSVQRTPYERIATVTWQQPVLDVVGVGPGRQRFTLELPDPGSVPAVVRDRVTASVLISEHVRLSAAAGARITARRPPGPVPGGDPDAEQVSWNVVFDTGVDAADPVLRAAADEAIAGLRASTGL